MFDFFTLLAPLRDRVFLLGYQIINIAHINFLVKDFFLQYCISKTKFVSGLETYVIHDLAHTKIFTFQLENDRRTVETSLFF